MTQRVLHILSGMNRGGVETWLMNVLRRLDTRVVAFDFLVETRSPADYDDEILSMGGRIFRSPRFRRRIGASLRLFEVLTRSGPYVAVHAHGRHDMAWPVGVAAAARVPVRIAHVHNVKDSHQGDPVRRAYKRVMKRVLTLNASFILGCSVAALESLYGVGAVAAHPELEMLPYGIDMNAFRPRASREDVRREFGLTPDSLIMGHVGRFVWEKNHEFLVDVFAELSSRDPRWVLLMVGDGGLLPDIERKLHGLGLRDRARFARVRADVPRLLSAMDVFAFPSVIEGFGLVVIEAQACGVPCVLGAHLPDELDVDPASVVRVGASAGAWADAAERVVTEHGGANREPFARAAHARVARSVFNIERSVDTLLSRYYKLLPDGHRVVQSV